MQMVGDDPNDRIQISRPWSRRTRKTQASSECPPLTKYHFESPEKATAFAQYRNHVVRTLNAYPVASRVSPTWNTTRSEQSTGFDPGDGQRRCTSVHIAHAEYKGRERLTTQRIRFKNHGWIGKRRNEESRCRACIGSASALCAQWVDRPSEGRSGLVVPDGISSCRPL